MSIGDDGFDDGKVVSLSGAKKRSAKKGGGGAGGGPDGGGPSAPYPDIVDCPVKPLGVVGGERFAFLTPSGRPVYLSARELGTGAVIGGLFDGSISWLRNHFPSDKSAGFGAIPAQQYLIRECVKLGFFQPEDDLRGAGAWRVDDGALLLHLGTKIVVYRERGSRIVDEVFPAGQRYGAHIYPAGPAQAVPAKEAATSDEVKDLFDLYATWNWEHKHAPFALLGFLGCAFVPGALRHRPHVWVTGDTSTGKTTLETLNRELMGASAIGAADATKMGIAYRLAGAAKSVWLDEMERDVDSSKQDALVELARIASSDSQQGIVRAAPGGQAMGWRIRACLYMSSILPAPLKPMDRNRIHVMDLRPLPPPKLGELRAFQERIAATKATLGPKLLTRVIQGFWRFQANERVVQDAMVDVWQRGGRVADQLGTLIAMAFALLSDQVVTTAAVKAVLAGFVLEDVVGHAEEAEAPRCINHLMTTSITYELDRGRQTRSIGEMIIDLVVLAEGRHGIIDNGARHRDLKRRGIALVALPFAPDAPPEMGIVVANDHQGLSPLFEGTRWRGGVWPSVLKRLPGANALKNPVRFSGIQRRGTFIPISELGLAFDHVETGTLDEQAQSPAPPAEQGA